MLFIFIDDNKKKKVSFFFDLIWKLIISVISNENRVRKYRTIIGGTIFYNNEILLVFNRGALINSIYFIKM